MKAPWVCYFLLISILKVVLLYQAKFNEVTFSDGFLCLLILGGYGFSFQLKILSEKVWRYIFFFAVPFYFHWFVVMPLIYFFANNIPPIKIILIMKYSIPYIPVIYVIFLYSWKSEKLWGLDAND